MPRPRAFDVDEATDRALELFWTRGFEGTTLDQLTTAMGINRPSLYATFGSKEGLFQRALERYVAGAGAPVLAALEAETARDAAFRVMRFYSDAVGIAGRPRGCLLVQGALVCNDANVSIRDALSAKRQATLALLTKRFERAKREGELPKEASAADLARYVWSVCQGLAVQSMDGASREQLRRVVDLAMQSFPG
ncbi:TetR/AcrR family transcriptional regulator [Sandaracinus amylolyticus]|uniref:TetR/AcrR family transcriptional regulator n=1 Tax=Sandaracinus amylolyticus TaxID=927083 RepID=UPI001F41104F|nr:TetR/AcrR family transcriptional regulator [Sandaracinus amylolyticus]UJR79704.1 HTH-type transcriptional repressor ComR [Sandaracinus amylolyticus]